MYVVDCVRAYPQCGFHTVDAYFRVPLRPDWPSTPVREIPAPNLAQNFGQTSRQNLRASIGVSIGATNKIGILGQHAGRTNEFDYLVLFISS